MDELVKFFREVGFPAGVAVFVLWRVETAIKDLTRTISDLTVALVAQGIEIHPRRARRPEPPPPLI